MPASARPHRLFDFADPAAAAGWPAIDDRVMGGDSRSRMRHDPAGHAVFEGVVSLAHGGGFASVRTPCTVPAAVVATDCVVECRGDGRRFKLALFDGDGFDLPSHQAEFAAPVGDWQTLRLPLARFVARWRGRDLPGAPALQPAQIRQAGLLTAGRTPGPFALEIRRIALA
jgi:hypothetical protein